MKKILFNGLWILLALVAAGSLAVIALNQGETINALWIATAALSIYVIGYRYYGLYIANNVLGTDPTRMTPAWRHNDGLDYVPTNQYILYGHHFAAIAGAGPLVGPVLAAQMGYLPGMLWILVGVILAGGVQDFMVLFLSTRRDGRSLGDLVKSELGMIPGFAALLGAFMIMVIILSVLALIVVKALTHSPWGTFTVAATIPLAVLMGLYLHFIRPGKIGEVSLVGFVLLIAAILAGDIVSHHPVLSGLFDFTGTQLTWLLIGYGFIASVLPVWLLLAPRDYLSTFLKIGVIFCLIAGIIIVAPELKMPALTKFVDGTGPAWSGTLFPFLFITIACGAVSGFHALIASGTTPKMLCNEKQARFIGYGGMLMESLVAIMALVAASIIEPGIYFAMNAPQAVLGNSIESAVQVINSWGFVITPEMLTNYTQDIGETSIISRAGGAPTLALGIAYILHQVVGGKVMMGFWYHFAILFEALFILTAVDAGTRSGRFMLQDLLGNIWPKFKNTESWIPSFIATGLCVAAWGYFVYQGVVDPFGGINTLWPLFGIANQMLAAMALVLCVAVLCKMKRQRYAWVAALPAIWLLICTFCAGFEKIFSSNPKVGFLSLAEKYAANLAQGNVLAPAVSLEEMSRLIFNNRLNAGLTGVFMLITTIIVIYGVYRAMQSLKSEQPTACETPYAWMDETLSQKIK